MPVPGKYQSAHALSVHGRFFLMDCGEGAQKQMIRFGISPMKLEAVFISHIHGDHVFGLSGLLSTLGMLGRTAPLDIYGPTALGPLVRFFLSYYGDYLAYEIRFTPVKVSAPEVIRQSKSLEVLAFPLNHQIETYGYLLREREPELNIDKDALARYGFTRAEIGRLKQGEDVLRPAGPDTEATFLNGFVRHSGTDEPMLIRADEVTFRRFKPRSYAYVSDTAPFPQLAGWVSGVDLLYHESTYLEQWADQAAIRHHSTAVQAAQCARAAGVRRLLIGHYSSRCIKPDAYQAEARTVFPETYAVSEGDVFDLPLEKSR